MHTLFEIKLEPLKSGSRQTTRDLVRQLKEAIETGKLARGARLPSTRESRAVFGVSRNTLAEVYERLLNDGYVVTRSSSGTFVAEALPKTHDDSRSSAPAPYQVNSFWNQPAVQADINFWSEQQYPPRQPHSGPTVDLRPGLIDHRLFPFQVFRRITSRQLRKLELRPITHGAEANNQGSYTLREAITQHIRITRAVVCRADEVVITAGAQQAFDLLAKILVVRGETVVAIEDPGYPPMRVAFAAAGAKLVPIEVDAEGLVVDKLPAKVDVICVCPSHQFPLGVSMSLRRRRELVEAARMRKAVIIEDDYDGEFRHDGGALEALCMRDAADVTFYVGTFSKSMLWSLRLGFVVAPKWAVRTLAMAKNCLDFQSPGPIQLAVAAFIAEGHLSQHVRKMRRIYKERRELLLAILSAQMSEWLEPVASHYGVHVCAVDRSGLDMRRLVEAVAEQGVLVHSLNRYYFGQETQSGLVIGYGIADLAEIRRGLAILRNVLQSIRSS